MIANLASYLDLANHHPEATERKIQKLCEDVLKYGFNSAFVNPSFVPLARGVLKGKAKVGTVISFPLGGDLLVIKKKAVQEAIFAGASELDISLNVTFIKESKWEQSLNEMKTLVAVARKHFPKVIIKFIPETGYLTSAEIKKAAKLILESGADFIKTCSGFGPRGASLEDVFFIKEAVGEKLKIKVAGGIKTKEQALSFIQAGASRIGTSQAVQIIQK